MLLDLDSKSFKYSTNFKTINMGIKRITTKDGDVFFVDSDSRERIKTPFDNIQSENGKEMIGALRCYEYISLKDLIFSYQGRIGRSVFFLYGIIMNFLFFFIVISFAVSVPTRNIPGGEGGLIFFAVAIDLFFVLPNIVKRLHDMNYSGAMAILLLLLMLVPLVNLISAICLLAIPGSFNENDYGLPTKFIFSKSNFDNIESAQTNLNVS